MIPLRRGDQAKGEAGAKRGEVGSGYSRIRTRYKLQLKWERARSMGIGLGIERPLPLPLPVILARSGVDIVLRCPLAYIFLIYLILNLKMQKKACLLVCWYDCTCSCSCVLYVKTALSLMHLQRKE